MRQRCKYLLLTTLLVVLSTLGYTSNLKTVRLQLKWKHQFQFAGYYAAIEKGYYKDVGLNVELLEAHANETPFEAVNSGKAEFGTCTTDILEARSKGMKPVILANVFQHSPHILITMQKSGIRSVHDLVGKRIAAEPGAADLYAFLSSEGVKLDRFSVEELDYSMEKFINGEVDAITAYCTDELYPLRKAGYDLNIMWPSSSGIDFYGDMLFTNEGLIKRNPTLVAGFREASLKGWAYALNNQEEIVNLIYNKYSQRHTLDHLRFEADETRKLILPDVVDIGYTNPGRWAHVIESYQTLNIIPSTFTVKGLLYSDYLKQPFKIPWKFVVLLAFALGSAIALILFFYAISRKLQKEIKNKEIVQKELTKRNADLGLLRQELLTKNATLMGVMESIPDSVFSVDLNYLYTSFNNRHAQIMKALFNTDIELGYSMLDSVMVEDDRQLMKSNIDRSINGEFFRVEYFSGRHRANRYFEVTFAPIFDPGSCTIGVMIMAKDITASKKSETRLKNMNENLEKHVKIRTKQLTDAVNEIDDFAYSLSHDLRTPLRGIDGFSSILLEDYGDKLDDNAKRYLKRIKKDSQRLGDVLDALHGLSNVSRKELSRAQTNLSEVADHIIKRFVSDYPQRDIEIVIQHGLIENCDKKLMKTALENLFSNAIKFTNQEANARVEFGMKTIDNVNTYFVKDNGIGFNMDYVNKLFHNFQRLHRYNDFEGIGIGLATVRRIVVKHGGTIWAESELGKGAAFYFTLTSAT